MRALSLGAVVAIGVGALLLAGLAGSAGTSTSADPAHRSADIHLGDQTQPPAAPQAAGIDPKVLQTYAGRYRLDGSRDVLDVIGETLIVTGEDGRLFIESKQGKSEMLPESELTFRIPQYRTTVAFVRDGRGRVNQMILNLMGLRELSAARIE
ncbi:MAG: hypothetical protein NTZ17_06705 [Phycisphaerae bacterium]|nr:hypothetical protein [Phycisphaerae bacterium]